MSEVSCEFGVGMESQYLLDYVGKAYSFFALAFDNRAMRDKREKQH